MLRRSFLASAAALLTLPVARLFGASKPSAVSGGTVRASELMGRFGENYVQHVVRDATIVVDADLFGIKMERCSLKAADSINGSRDSAVVAYCRLYDPVAIEHDPRLIVTACVIEWPDSKIKQWNSWADWPAR